MSETITSGPFAQLLDITPRAASELIGKLEGLGFKFGKDLFGGRKVPVALAHSVAELRRARKPLEALLSDPRFSGLRGGAAPNDALGLLIEARADYAVAREIVSQMISALERDGTPIEPMAGWSNSGVSNPNGGQW